MKLFTDTYMHRRCFNFRRVGFDAGRSGAYGRVWLCIIQTNYNPMSRKEITIQLLRVWKLWGKGAQHLTNKHAEA